MRFDPLVDLTRASLVTAIIGLASIAAAQQDEAAFFKRSVALGLPLLADAGTPSNEHSGESGEGRRGEPEESGTQYGLSDTAKEVRSGVELIVRFDGARRAFSGTVKNGTDATVRRVRVEVHLSNGALEVRLPGWAQRRRALGPARLGQDGLGAGGDDRRQSQRTDVEALLQVRRAAGAERAGQHLALDG